MRKTVYSRTEIQTDTLGQFETPTQGSVQIERKALRDVFLWGEGTVGGCLGCFGNFTEHNGRQVGTLFPQLLESPKGLDIQNISLGAKHAVLVTKQGEVYSWGEGSQGRLGYNVNMDITSPKIVESLSGVRVKSVACSEYQTSALTFSGELYMWGENCYVANLVGKCTNKGQWLPHRISGLLDGLHVSQVACGEWHMAIVSSSGQLFTLGDGTFGVLGHGNLETISQPKEIKSLKGLWAKSVACGPWHTAAVVEVMADRYKFNDPSGKLFTWGDGDNGKLGHADQERKLVPTCVAQLVDHDFVQVACGRMLTAALTNMGKVYTMGSNVHGQLGNPSAKDKSVTLVQGMLKNEFVKEISSGSYHVAVLTSSGSVYTWGRGVNGQLGLGDSEDRKSPTLVEALREMQVESVTCGSNNTAAICSCKSVSTIDQPACMGCGMAFGFARKKHNCYNCGLLFCHACSSRKAANAALVANKSKHFRVCDKCFTHLKRNSNLGQLPKLENFSPRLQLTVRKALFDETADRRRAITTPRQMIVTRKSHDENSQSHGRRHIKNQAENQQSLDFTNSFPCEFQRWGQVSCPILFRHPIAENNGNLSVTKKQLYFAPVCSTQLHSLAKPPPSDALNVEENFAMSNTVFEEIQKLKAEAESLGHLCQTRSEKIQECKQRIEETWSLAKKEAAKCKAAKEVIEVLTLKLDSISEKLYAQRELKDRDSGHLSQSTSTNFHSPTLKWVNTMLTTASLSPEVGQLEDRKDDSLCSSPILFSNTLKSMSDRDLNHEGCILGEELIAERTELTQDESDTMKLQWIEKYEPGVYVTFMTLPNGQKGFKRVRFSRKRFTEKEAERWWEENEQVVYQKYEVEGYISTDQDAASG